MNHKMKQKLTREYMVPIADVYSVKVENGFTVSQNPDLSYGEPGGAGTIENGNSYEL